MTPQPPRSGGPDGSELSFDELLSGGPGTAPPAGGRPATARPSPGAATGSASGQDRHARRPRVRPPSVLDLRAQTPVGGVTPEFDVGAGGGASSMADRVLDLGRPAGAPTAPAAGPPPLPAPTPARRPVTRVPAPVPVDPDAAAQERELEERVALVLRSPETLRGVHQPIVDLRTGDCVGYEAFVRVADWPARSPRPWFDAAARVGLAAQLEAAALATSLRARLTMPGDRLLAVNLSTASLTEDQVLRVLDDEDDLARLLLTPSPAREALAPAAAADALAALRGRGMLLGVKLREAGRADLDVVEGLRPDVVVLTREFAADVHHNPWRQRLLVTLARIAAETGAAVLATGIESVADARCLQRCGMHLGQGWLFGRPRPGFLPPPAGTEEWLRDGVDRSERSAPTDRTDRSEGADTADEAADAVDEPDDADEPAEARAAADDDIARRVAAANAVTTPPGIPVPRPRIPDGGDGTGPGRHTAEHPVLP